MFYSRFESTVEGQAGQPMMPSWPCTKSPSFKIEEYEVRNLLQRQNSRKAAGPDSISSATLKWCAFILAPVLTDIFNWSLRVCRVPACFKAAVIIPVPKKSNISCLDQWFLNFLHQVPPQKIFAFPSTTIMTNIKMQYKWLPTAPGVCSRCVCVCVCVCVFTAVCVCTLYGLNAEHKFRVCHVTFTFSSTIHSKKKKTMSQF